ncbi:mechanosensitive ion channel family protein [SCandidatus Aminicenantes bacterium Aminicenantia_JdfR_composite]|jgi:MscS family membrane protein|nr:mechanosensitive ion channel family protein [SCandidatus Aminicenantes bacterium Aminicenantia_JdfR_composite]MCP2596893.1 mechanosensitive ion channel family protein [Candidatus Aminicenantes bacterium AC-335-G13]
MKLVSEIFKFIIENVYLKFLLTLLISLVVAYLTKITFKKILLPITKKTKTVIDDLIVKSSASIIFWVILILGVKIGIEYFKFGTGIYNSIVSTLLVLAISILIFKIINNLSQQWLREWAFKTKSTADDRLIPLIEKILKALVIILAIIFIFDAWNINIGPILATAGIAGVALALAVKESLANIIGGVQLVLDKTFKVGDKVQLESGEVGVILDIGLRTTKLKTYDNEVIYIPNSYLANSKIKNYSQPDLSQRVNVEFGVEYGSDPEKVKKVVVDAIKKINTVLEDPPPEVIFTNLSDFSLDFIARAWVKNYNDAFSTSLKMREAIYDALNKANIGIPFPTRTIYVKQSKE